MSREYKFRLWNREDREWDSPGLLEVWDGSGVLSTMYGKENYIINQCTGLKDKNGKEIYEGDIIKVKRCHMDALYNLIEDGEEIGHVFWFSPSCQFTISFEHIRHDDFDPLDSGNHRYEVVGNIHENSELVKL